MRDFRKFRNDEHIIFIIAHEIIDHKHVELLHRGFDFRFLPHSYPRNSTETTFQLWKGKIEFIKFHPAALPVT